MCSVATCTPCTRIASTQIVIETDIEQIVQGPPVVVGNRDAALIFTSGLGARIIGGETGPKRKALFPLDDEVALTRLSIRFLSRGHLYVGLRRWEAREVFECLFDVAQIE